MPKYKVFPQNPNTKKLDRYPVTQVGIWRNEVEIERAIGSLQGNRAQYPVYRVATYENITDASMGRLNRVMAHIVNTEQQAIIHLSLPYGVEFEF